jgi:hypothetical protein
MEIEEDDLPDGYPDVWGITVGYLRENRQKGRGRKTHTRQAATPLTEKRRATLARFYLRKGPTDDWEENRRIYNRRKDPRGRQT